MDLGLAGYVLQKEVVLRGSMAMLGSFGIKFRSFSKVLFNSDAIVESKPQLKLRKGIAITGRLPNSFENVKLAHARIVLDAIDGRQSGCLLRRIRHPLTTLSS